MDFLFENEPKVTVIIPTYNRAHLISSSINSVIRQTIQDWEIIVVDDSSTDNTESVINEYADTRIRYIRNNSNMGGAYSRNVGIDLARGQFISFLDSDDEWYPHKLEKQLVAMSSISDNCKDVVCYTRLVADDGIGKKIIPARAKLDNERIGDYLLIHDGMIQTSTILIPLELAKATRFNSHLRKHQDWDFCIRLDERGANFIMLEEPLVRWSVDVRPDRVSLSPNFQFSLDWLEEKKQSLSYRARKAFLANIVAVPAGLSGKKFIALKYIMEAFLCGSLPPVLSIKYATRCLFPPKTYAWLRKTFNH